MNYKNVPGMVIGLSQFVFEQLEFFNMPRCEGSDNLSQMFARAQQVVRITLPAQLQIG